MRCYPAQARQACAGNSRRRGEHLRCGGQIAANYELLPNKLVFVANAFLD